MNMVRCSIYFQWSAMKTIYQATKVSVQLWTQLFGDQGNSILRSINDVIKEIRV